ncbi:MAG TPA: pentapeptide repeat-containing protein [Sedimentisphaerales bacterium]|nr:pentapeptide repeat-containing protein [Sedimentisphaerales bacterium]
MANPEHLKILTQGIEAWNEWRRKNQAIRPDLSFTDLANLICFWPHAGGYNLSKANLSYSRLRTTDLSGGDLRQAKLQGADLLHTKLSGANLSRSNALMANLGVTNLRKANLKESDLRWCCLVRSNLSGTILTGTKLYGTSRDDWVIKGVKCDYVYWDAKGERRSPKDRDLEPGEFERLYAALPTIEYIFENGMLPIDPLIMDRVVQAIREKSPEFDIKIDSINARGLAPSIKFTVQHKEHKEPALAEVQRGYDERINRLEAEKERLYHLLGQAIDKDNVKLIAAGRDATVAMDSATINIEQHIHNALELQRAIADEPEESKSFAKVAKKTALDIISGAIKDIAKGQVKEVAKEIIELGRDLGPIIAKTAAYAFFSNMC